MRPIKKNLATFAVAVVCAMAPVFASFAATSAFDSAQVKATIFKWIADLNKGDLKAVTAACAPHAAIVDGFPPYAWQTCADWMNGCEANNQAIQGDSGVLSIGNSSMRNCMATTLMSFTPRHLPTCKTASRLSARAP